MAVPIKSLTIPYLSREILDKWANLTIFCGVDGQKTKINPLALSAFSPVLKEAILQDEVVIISEFSRQEIQTLVDFVSEGILPGNCGNVQEFAEYWKPLLRSFGVDFDQFRTQDFLIKADQIKCELVEEDLDEDVDWKPEMAYEDDDEEDEDEDDVKPDPDYTDYNYHKRPKKERNPNLEPKLIFNRIERCVNKEYSHLRRFYGHIIYTRHPENHMPKLSQLESYSLPTSLETYIEGPSADVQMKVETTTKAIPCTKCPLTFSTKLKLEKHDIKSHQNHYVCSYCSRLFPLTMETEFIAHIYRHDKMGLKAHECIRCGYSTYVYRSILHHVASSGPYHKATCPQCPMSKFITHQEYSNHLNLGHPGLPCWSCDICGSLFPDQESMKSHKGTDHQGVKMTRKGTVVKKKANKAKKIVCDLCGKTMLAPALAKHKAMIHGPAIPTECPQCQKIFKTPQHLEAHVRSFHQKFACDICGLIIPSKHKSRHFQQYHTNPEDRKYKCQHCGKGFATNQNLKDHTNVHTGEKPYICKFCGKGFASSGNQQMHMRTAHLGHKRNSKS